MLPSHLQCPGQLLAYSDERGLPWLVEQGAQTGHGKRPWFISSEDKARGLKEVDDAIEALEALARLVPADADVVPPASITSAVGRQILANEPRRFSRIRLGSRREVFVQVRTALLAAQPKRQRDQNLDALFAQVLARPDDDPPRLVFADAIGATDPECGEFILAEVTIRQARRAGRAADPSLVTLAASHLRRFADVWANGLPKRADAWSFRGGFVEHVELSATQFAAEAPKLFALAPLRHVTLTGLEHGLGSALAQPGMQQLVALTLKGAGDLAALESCRPLARLEVLDLREVVDARAPGVKWPRLRSVLLPGTEAPDHQSL